MALNSIIRDSSQLKDDWESLLVEVEKSDIFPDWFINLENYDDFGYSYEKKQFWIEDEHVSSLTDKRIPFHLLKIRGLSFYDNDVQGLKFRNDLLKKLTDKFKHSNHSPNFSNLGSEIGSGEQVESIATSLNDSFGMDLDLGSDTYSESPIGPKKILRSSSTNQVHEKAKKNETSRGR